MYVYFNDEYAELHDDGGEITRMDGGLDLIVGGNDEGEIVHDVIRCDRDTIDEVGIGALVKAIAYTTPYGTLPSELASALMFELYGV